MKLGKEEHLRLLRALIKANNAFHDSLKESGYHVSYSLLDTLTGSIYDDARPTWDRWPLGELTIKWKLNVEKEENGK